MRHKHQCLDQLWLQLCVSNVACLGRNCAKLSRAARMKGLARLLSNATIAAAKYRRTSFSVHSPVLMTLPSIAETHS